MNDEDRRMAAELRRMDDVPEGHYAKLAFALNEAEWMEFVAYMQNPGPPDPKWDEVARGMQEYREKKAKRKDAQK